jgi:hypothetical protein
MKYAISMTTRMVVVAAACLVLFCALLFTLGILIGACLPTGPVTPASPRALSDQDNAASVSLAAASDAMPQQRAAANGGEAVATSAATPSGNAGVGGQ